MKNNLDTQQNVKQSIPINDRFLDVLNYYNYSGYKLSQETNISQSQITHIKSYRNKVSDEVMEELLKKFPEISKDWLLTGNGSMLKTPPLTPIQQKNILKKLKKLFISLRSRITNDQKQDFKQYEALLSQGENIVTHELIEEIVTTFPDINKEWLTANKGAMFLSDNDLINGKDINHTISKIKSKNGTEEVSPVPELKYMMVEYVDLSVSAGMLGGDFSASLLESLPDTHKRLVPREYKDGNYLVVRINGDSMDDGTKRSISDNDEVLIRLYTDTLDTLPMHNKLFVITTRSGYIIKQITKIDQKKQQITCHSFNPLYPDQFVDFENILQIFTVEKIVNSKIRF